MSEPTTEAEVAAIIARVLAMPRVGRLICECGWTRYIIRDAADPIAPLTEADHLTAHIERCARGRAGTPPSEWR